MAHYGTRSQGRLDTCHPDLIKIFQHVVQIVDNSILEGERTLEQQQIYFRDGKSKLDGVNKKSKHQSRPSLAVDAAPYPIDWGDKGTATQKLKAKARFYHLAGVAKGIAKMLYDDGQITHLLRWGGDWDKDNDFADQSFDDLPHFELYKP